MIQKGCLAAIVLGALLAEGGMVYAAPVRVKHGEVELLAERASVEPGETVWLALRFRLDPGWHTYWLNPGESGMPPRLTWTLPDGFSAGAIRFPPPSRFESEGIVSFGFEKEVVLFVPVTAPAMWLSGRTVTVGLKADWLVCSDLCLPETARLNVELNGDASASGPEVARLFDEARARLPSVPEGWNLQALRRDGEVILRVEPPPEIPGAEPQGAFFPSQPNLFTYLTASVPQDITGIRLAVSPLAETFPTRVTGVLVVDGKALAVDVPIESKGDEQ
jgi:DsbC/DsbD-like thiol-disulfide interchange protein